MHHNHFTSAIRKGSNKRLGKIFTPFPFGTGWRTELALLFDRETVTVTDSSRVPVGSPQRNAPLNRCQH